MRLIDRTLRATEAVVTQIDLAAGKLATSVGTVGFDELLLAAGAALAPESVPGLSEAAHGFYTREDATRLRDALVSFGGGRVLVVVAAMAFKCRRAVGMLLPKAGVFAHAESEVRSSPTTRRCSGRQARRRVLRRPQWMLSGDRRRARRLRERGFLRGAGAGGADARARSALALGQDPLRAPLARPPAVSDQRATANLRTFRSPSPGLSRWWHGC